jgi:hypothetical protein
MDSCYWAYMRSATAANDTRDGPVENHGLGVVSGGCRESSLL